jgi:SAM-dependent methyltransferase
MLVGRLKRVRCRRIAGVLQGYLDGEVDAVTTRQVAAHLERCRQCGLEAATPDRAWTTYVARYHEVRAGITETALDHARHPQLGTAHDWLVAGLPGGHGDVLDVACGSAPLRPRLDVNSYLGVDLSMAELDVARARGRGPVVRGDARALPLPTASVDTLVCSMGLMLVDPARAAVVEFTRVLRPGGRLGLLLPAVWPVRARDVPPVAVLALTLRGPGSMPQRFSPRRIDRLLGEAGLVVESVQRRRFGFPLRDAAAAGLAVDALYTPGRRQDRLERAADRQGEPDART